VSTFGNYLSDLGMLLKEDALEAKKRRQPKPIGQDTNLHWVDCKHITRFFL
jgi:hypothetical protein